MTLVYELYGFNRGGNQAGRRQIKLFGIILFHMNRRKNKMTSLSLQYDDLINPVLQALKELGGSGRMKKLIPRFMKLLMFLQTSWIFFIIHPKEG